MSRYGPLSWYPAKVPNHIPIAWPQQAVLLAAQYCIAIGCPVLYFYWLPSTVLLLAAQYCIAIGWPVLSQILLIIRRVASGVSLYFGGLLVFCTLYSGGTVLYSGGFSVLCTLYSILCTLVVSLYSVFWLSPYSLYSGQPPLSSNVRRFDDNSKRLKSNAGWCVLFHGGLKKIWVIIAIY